MSNSRRDFMKTMALGGLAAGAAMNPLARAALGSSSLAPSNPKKYLIYLFMFGGADMQGSIAIPNSDVFSNYVSARQNVHYPRSEVLHLDARWGMHPALSELKAVWDLDQLAICHQVGVTTDKPSLSHFVSQDTFWTAQASKGNQTAGWLADLGANVGWAPLDAIGSGVPNFLLMRGNPSYRPLVLKSTEDFKIPGTDALPMGSCSDRFAARNQTLRDMEAIQGANPQGSASQQAINEVATSTFDQIDLIKAARDAYMNASFVKGDYTGGSGGAASGFAASLQDIARLIHGRETAVLPGSTSQVLVAGIGGHDTHTQQKNRMDALWGGQIAGGLAGLRTDLENMGVWDDTAIVLLTEFGRRNATNGSGTDHGHGNAMLVWGGGVQGGHYGTPPSNDDWNETNMANELDFRKVIYELLTQHLSVNQVQARSVLTSQEPAGDPNYFDPGATGCLGLFPPVCTQVGQN